MMDYSEIAVIGNEDIIAGFEMAGVSGCEESPNLILIEGSRSAEEIRGIFTEFVARRDLAIIFICDYVAEKIRDSIDEYKQVLPCILVIPSRNST